MKKYLLFIISTLLIVTLCACSVAKTETNTNTSKSNGPIESRPPLTIDDGEDDLIITITDIETSFQPISVTDEGGDGTHTFSLSSMSMRPID